MLSKMNFLRPMPRSTSMPAGVRRAHHEPVLWFALMVGAYACSSSVVQGQTPLYWHDASIGLAGGAGNGHCSPASSQTNNPRNCEVNTLNRYDSVKVTLPVTSVTMPVAGQTGVTSVTRSMEAEAWASPGEAGAELTIKSSDRTTSGIYLDTSASNVEHFPDNFSGIGDIYYVDLVLHGAVSQSLSGSGGSARASLNIDIYTNPTNSAWWPL